MFLFRYPKRDFRNPNKRTKIEKIAGNKKGIDKKTLETIRFHR
ncbi:hypothetical protein ALIPUT_00236 [Alistipes putredinis DSM 17216]|uniref:Uncharacterized protein n=1 Tax=Alistipes putredinis DSM 17216 TaxID=445970 RepID=B0MT00_9BACT|nr:hypothetical protein ALIPUT_00236 [Alistipes putredinis DSM 17216]